MQRSSTMTFDALHQSFDFGSAGARSPDRGSAPEIVLEGDVPSPLNPDGLPISHSLPLRNPACKEVEPDLANRPGHWRLY